MERLTLTKNIPSASLYFPTPLQLSRVIGLFLASEMWVLFPGEGKANSPVSFFQLS